MRQSRILRVGVLAGIAGGLAEIAWVCLYGALTGADTASVARGVAGAFSPALAAGSYGVASGIAIHMLLAVALGLAVAAVFSAPFLSRVDGWSKTSLVLLTLGLVWAFNFLVVLPAIDPAFTTLLPIAVTLASKLLFGVGAAATFRTQAIRRR
jgi:hypothetical protein